MFASRATSSRRRPDTRRLRPYVARPARSGLIRARREVRNSRIGFALLGASASRLLMLYGGTDGTPNDRVFLGTTTGGSMGGERRELRNMTDKKVWFITGAGRGIGFEIARAVLAAGGAVVATGRDTDAVARAVGEADNLLVVKLDITQRADAKA